MECTRRPVGAPANSAPANGGAAGRRGRILDHCGGTRWAAVPDDRAARTDAGPILRVPCAGTRCNGATDPDDAAGGTIGCCNTTAGTRSADDRYTVTRREAVHRARAKWGKAGAGFPVQSAARCRLVADCGATGGIAGAAGRGAACIRPVFATAFGALERGVR